MSRVLEITNLQEHDSFIANNDLAVIFFGSDRCQHCRNMVPVVENLADQYPSVAFAHIEVTKVKVENIKGVPAFVGYKMGNPVDIVIGADPEQLIDMIETKLLQ